MTSTNHAALSAAELFDQLEVDLPESISPTMRISGINTLDQAGHEDISFLVRNKYRPRVSTSRAAVIIAPPNIKVSDPRVVHVPKIWPAIIQIVGILFPDPPPTAFVHPSCSIARSAIIGNNVEIGAQVVIDDSATIGNRVRIGAHCYIGPNAVIGDDCLLHPRVTIAQDCVVKNRVIIHSGAVIGSDGYRYEMIDGRLTKIPQIGNVILEDDVEVGANTTIDRAGFSSTIIGARTKIDNLVQIAHNCVIGSDCIIVAQVGIAGSTTIGRGVMIGGQAGIRDNTIVGDGVRIGAKSGAFGNVAPGTELQWNPPIDSSKYKRTVKLLHNLPDLMEELRPLIEEQRANKKNRV